MVFSQILQELEKLREEFETACFLPLIERDILKNRVSELYLLLVREAKGTEAQVSYVGEDTKINRMIDNSPLEPAPAVDPSQVTSSVKKEVDIDYKTLADVFLEKDTMPKQDPGEDNTILGRISQSRITDLKRAIAMNDRFIFIKELFKNDFEAYNRCINDLNEYTEIEKAQNYLQVLHADYRWDEKNDIVKYFVSIIHRKFS